MKLHIQDPSFIDSYTLHEALLNSSINSIRGGGAYAFITSGGVRLLLEDELFLNFLKKSTFQLVIGTDAITNEKALNKLEILEGSCPKLNVKAFYHKLNNITFHPKFCWFKKEKGGVVILGSGNLTEKGLRKNWEAFTIFEVSEKEIVEIESQWDKWIDHNNEYMKLISDPEVIQKAKTNKNISRKIKKDILPIIDSIEDIPETDMLSEDNEDLEAWQYGTDNIVLIAEIPRADTRWNQANFNKDTFINFFGATPGDNSLRILLRNIKDDGSLNDIEIRPSVTVKSRNFRFELEVAAGVNYPEKGRPIGVFVRISKRMFLYMLFLPTNSKYDELLLFLDQLHPPTEDRMRRCLTNITDLETNCPNLPIWVTRGT